MAAQRRKARAPEPVRYGSVTTPWGKLWLAASGVGIVAVSFRSQPAGRLAEALGKRVAVVLVRDPEGLAESYGKALSAFLDGRTGKLKLPVDYRGMHEFQAKVYEAIREIPPGDTWTYAEVAEKVATRRHARAVGQALAANPVPIVIPCHRVVESRGGLGGYTAGTVWKRRLLALERGQQVLEV
jgi:O-6-methylguanine DNA methyltransferase